jgi:hypothetical protein
MYLNDLDRRQTVANRNESRLGSGQFAGPCSCCSGAARRPHSQALLGGSYARANRGFHGLGLSSGICVPLVPVLTTAAQINSAVSYNSSQATSVGWGSLRDQIEVNILGCLRPSPPLSDQNFAQVVARFQQSEGMTHDGKLGPGTWNRMKSLQVEREPFPRHPINQHFNDTHNPAKCEAHEHPAIDVGVFAGTPVPVVADGVVRYSGIVGSLQHDCSVATPCVNLAPSRNPAICSLLSYGRAVIVEHLDRGPAPANQSVYTIYAHLQNLRVAPGQSIRAGRIVGEIGAGCVGESTGPHLHYALVTGPKFFSFQRNPVRCQICAAAYCSTASCANCNFIHFWDEVTPRRPRTISGSQQGFRW